MPSISTAFASESDPERIFSLPSVVWYPLGDSNPELPGYEPGFLPIELKGHVTGGRNTARNYGVDCRPSGLERMTGYDPARPAWKAGMLPITSHPRISRSTYYLISNQIVSSRAGHQVGDIPRSAHAPCCGIWAARRPAKRRRINA